MEQDAQGQWRIGNPPPGLLVSQYLFERFYNGFDVFFFDPTFTTVVPDPIYVARGQQSATTLVEALLDGPTEWLEPAVVSALPAQTQLGLSIPTTAEGVAEVSLNDAVNQLTAEQRSRMAAQVVWTLRQLPQTTAVRFLVDGAPYVVPGQRADGTVSVDAYEHLAPVPAGLSSQLYLARAEGVSRLVEVQGSLQPVPVEGPLGTLGRGVASMAVAPTPGGEVAVVSEDRTRVDVAETLPGAPLTTVLSGAEGLLTPQFSRDHDLWLVERRRGSSQLHVVVDGELRPVRAPELEDSEVVAFRISPDGTRMAVVRRVDGGTELGLALVRRGEEVGVDSYRSIPLVSATGRELTVVQDVEWADATTFMLLARSDADRQSLPWLVDQDGAEMQQVGSGGWSPDSLQVSPSPTNPRAAAVGPDGQLWLHQGDYRWPEVLSEVTAAAYPG
nr:GerMN domain-containing protein [Auraticoccus cholistanensis]